MDARAPSLAPVLTHAPVLVLAPVFALAPVLALVLANVLEPRRQRRPSKPERRQDFHRETLTSVPTTCVNRARVLSLSGAM